MSTQVKKTISILMFATVCLAFGGIVNQRAEASVCFLPDDAMCDEEGVRSTKDYGFWPGGSGNGKTVSACDSSYNSSRGGSNCKQCTDKTSRYYGYYKCGDDVNCDEYNSDQSENACGRCEKCMISGDKNYGKYKCAEDCDSCADYTDELPADYNDPNTCQAKVCEACPTDNTKYKCEDKTDFCPEGNYQSNLTAEQIEKHCEPACDICYDEHFEQNICDTCFGKDYTEEDCPNGYQVKGEGCEGKGGKTFYEGCCNKCKGYEYNNDISNASNGWTCTECEHSCDNNGASKFACSCNKSGWHMDNNGECVRNNNDSKEFCIIFNYRCQGGCPSTVANDVKMTVNRASLYGDQYDDGDFLPIKNKVDYSSYCYDYNSVLTVARDNEAVVLFDIGSNGDNPEVKPANRTWHQVSQAGAEAPTAPKQFTLYGNCADGSCEKRVMVMDEGTLDAEVGQIDTCGDVDDYYTSLQDKLIYDRELDHLGLYNFYYVKSHSNLNSDEVCSAIDQYISESYLELPLNESVTVTENIDVDYAKLPNGSKKCVYVRANCLHAQELFNLYGIGMSVTNSELADFCLSSANFKVKGSYDEEELNKTYEFTYDSNKSSNGLFVYKNCDIPDWDAGELTIYSKGFVDYKTGLGSDLQRAKIGGYQFVDENRVAAGGVLVQKVALINNIEENIDINLYPVVKLSASTYDYSNLPTYADGNAPNNAARAQNAITPELKVDLEVDRRLPLQLDVDVTTDWKRTLVNSGITGWVEGKVINCTGDMTFGVADGYKNVSFQIEQGSVENNSDYTRIIRQTDIDHENTYYIQYSYFIQYGSCYGGAKDKDDTNITALKVNGTTVQLNKLTNDGWLFNTNKNYECREAKLTNEGIIKCTEARFCDEYGANCTTEYLE